MIDIGANLSDKSFAQDLEACIRPLGTVVSKKL